jgi:DNA-binding LytR/AlgR family response regulator
MMKALIVEDELLASRNLKALLDELGNIEVLASLESITETVEWFSINKQPDILFLDIHLADGSAFEIFERIHISCPVVFTTAYDEYALKAFKVSSIDYLLKPIDLNSVRRAIKKLELFTPKNNSPEEFKNFVESYTKTLSYKTHFLLPSKGDKLVPLQAADIAYIYIDAGLVKAITFEGKIYRFEFTLDELAEMLNPSDFFRANRQYIISRKAIKDIDLWFNSRLSVNLKTDVPEKILISKARIQEFKNWFSGK